MSYVLQDVNGQIASTHSISAGLDYAAVGPEHAFLHDARRAAYIFASDAESLEGFTLCTQLEGITPALETSHVVIPAIRIARQLSSDDAIIVNLSGRGDKDAQLVAQLRRRCNGFEKNSPGSSGAADAVDSFLSSPPAIPISPRRSFCSSSWPWPVQISSSFEFRSAIPSPR